jgi:hypothetical protein
MSTEPFITTDIKLKPTFTDRLAKLAGTDAKHDFGLAYAILEKIQVGLPKSGWPKVKETPFFDESSSLTSVILTRTQEESSLQNLITGNDRVDFDIKYGPASDQSLHKYTGIKRFIKNGTGFNKGSPFVTDCGLEGSVLVVDFNQNGFLEMLTTGPSSDEIVNYVMIPELLNDPAGKTPLDDNIFNKHKPKQGVGTGVDLRPWLEITDKTIVYNSYNPQIEAFSNNFFSNYNFQLSPIIATKQISGKSTTMHVTLNILEPGSGNQAEVKNCKKENSIKSLLKFLTSLLKNTTSRPFNYSAKLQQKRSGDWFQALACLDIYNRKFKQFNANNADESFTKTNKVYFVTHDQIACAYALTMGVNAIFINNKNAYVLTNVKNDTSTTPTQRLLSNYQKVLWDITPDKKYAMNVNFRHLTDTFLPGYNTLRTTLINTYATNITNKLTALETVMNANSNNCISVSAANQYSVCIQNIFQECVMYCHVMISLPDPTQIIDIFDAKENINEFKKSANDPSLNSVLIETFVHAYNLAINIKNQHNNVVATSSKWLTALQKSDAYRSASSWRWDYKKSGRIRNFIISITAGTTTDTTNDMYLFLSFIGSINTTIANKITTVFKQYETVVTKTHAGNWDGRVLFTSNNSELIKQIGIFLTRTDADFQKEKKYFAFSPYLSEKASSKYYIVDNVITSKKPSNVAEPNYWPVPLCTEGVLVDETSESIKHDNDNPTIGSPKDMEVVITSAYSEPSCDNDDVPIITTESSVGKIGGFDESKSVQIVTDISIQQTSVPILTAFLIYRYMTDDSKKLVDLMKDVNIPASINDNLTPKLTPKGQLLELNQIKEDDTYELMGGGFDINDVKISDTSIAYHPLLPIYMIACGYNYNITPDLEGSLDYDVYIKYLGFLEKMTSVLTGYNYLSNVGQNKSKNIAKSYIIGLALRELLFTLNRDEDGIQIICENGANSALNATRDEYQSFSLMSSMLSDYISGKISEDATEKAFGIQLLQSDVFKNFINVEVDIKSLLNKTLTQQEESISISALNQRSLDLIKKISDRIVRDRSSGPSSSQGISSSQLSSVSMSTGTTPDTLSSLSSSLTSALTSPISVGTGGFLKTKKHKRKRTQKTKRRKNKRSNKKSKKNHRRRKQSKKESINSSTS